MTDIVERLRDPKLDHDCLHRMVAADEIESLRQQLAECQDMYSDLEAVYKHSVDNENNLTAQLAIVQKRMDLEADRAAQLDVTLEDTRQQLAETQEELRVCQQEAIGYREQLAECQARERVLRDKVELVCEGWTLPFDVRKILETAVAIPSDSTALDTMLKQAKREMAVLWLYLFEHGYWNDADDVIGELNRMAKELE